MSGKSEQPSDLDLSAAIEKADVFALAQAALPAPRYAPTEEEVPSPPPRESNELTDSEASDEGETAAPPVKSRIGLYSLLGLIVVLLGVGFWYTLPLFLQEYAKTNKEIALQPLAPQQNGNAPIPAPNGPAPPVKAAQENKPNNRNNRLPNQIQQGHGGVRVLPDLPNGQGGQAESRIAKAIFVQLPRLNEQREPTDYNREVILARELRTIGTGLSSFIDKTAIKIRGVEKVFKIEWDIDALIFERMIGPEKFEAFGKLVLTGKSLRFSPLVKDVSSDDVEALLQALAVKVNDDTDIGDVLFFVRSHPGADFEKGVVTDDLKEKMTLKSIERPNDPATFVSGALHAIPDNSTISYFRANIALAPELNKMLSYSIRCGDQVRLLNGNDQPCNEEDYSLQITGGDLLKPDKLRVKYSITCNEAKIKECLELKKAAQKDETQRAKADELEESLKNDLPAKVEFNRIMVMGKIKDTEFEIWRMDVSQMQPQFQKPQPDKLGPPRNATVH